MQNYVQGQVVSPTGKFEALQSGDGHALLFAIDEEQSGTCHTGGHHWSRESSAETGRMWQAQEITLASPPEQSATSFMSYTTVIRVTQMDQQLSAPHARYPSKTVAGGILGSPEFTPLVDPSVPDRDVGDLLGSVPGAISSGWGDIWQATKHGAGSVGRMVYDTATKNLHFFAKIGAQFYHVILDSYNAWTGAGVWILKQLNATWGKLKQYFQAMLHWDDIRRTKDVMHNLIRLWLHDQVNYIPRARQALDSTILEVEQQVNQWARILGDPPAFDQVENLVLELLTAVANEGQVLGAVFSHLQDLVQQFHSLSVVEILQKWAAILVDGTLSSVQVVVDALLNVLAELAQAALGVLDTKIHIPIISDLLNMIGVPDISFLDLFTWIGAVAVTVVYKISEGHYPFPKGDSEVQILSYISKGCGIALKVVFCGPAQTIFKKIGEKAPVLRTGNLVVQDYRGTGAFLDAVLCLHDAVVTAWHFYELSQKTNDTTRSTAFAGEAANIASFASRISYAFAVNDDEQDTRLAFILIMGAANDAFGTWKMAQVATGASLF
ncbi:uncharacterized protein BO80DRAFT_504675 [Aspergillus ibericus CBS 121593]|uniref:Uncharacterized protein n=1 Tax=Aspergillus ibericus CBS 121593 TaxID=1448316 RepID=A0A395GR79_9EURO|nr:hypothetical protein BO80DRAFT_504675 [Aspergillus ibericus CBS 121593]RAK97468.1 hypothetical protein BO80DRAFT_504675 [Aspergillus ibericus CBS 121593]